MYYCAEIKVAGSYCESMQFLMAIQSNANVLK
jgi:hypothetical protein